MDEMMTVGLCRLSRRGLEQARAAGRRLRVRVTGVLVIAGDVSPALAVDTIVAVELRGPLVAGGAVRCGARSATASPARERVLALTGRLMS